MCEGESGGKSVCVSSPLSSANPRDLSSWNGGRARMGVLAGPVPLVLPRQNATAASSRSRAAFPWAPRSSRRGLRVQSGPSSSIQSCGRDDDDGRSAAPQFAVVSLLQRVRVPSPVVHHRRRRATEKMEMRRRVRERASIDVPAARDPVFHTSPASRPVSHGIAEPTYEREWTSQGISARLYGER